MERAQAVPNGVYLLRIAAWVLLLEAVTEFYGSAHWHFLLRRLVAFPAGGDSGRPWLPDEWGEW